MRALISSQIACLAGCFLIASLAPGQTTTTKTLPGQIPGPTFSQYLGGSDFRMGVLIDRQALGKALKGRTKILALQFRDLRLWPVVSSKKAKIPSLATLRIRIRASFGSSPSQAPKATFAINHGKSPTDVFNGSIVIQNPSAWNKDWGKNSTPFRLPKLTFSHPLPIPSTGNLFLEIEAWDPAKGFKPVYWSWGLETAGESLGESSKKIGAGCIRYDQDPKKSTGSGEDLGVFEDNRLMPGGTLAIEGTGPKNAPGLLFLGLQSTILRLDAFGAQGCNLFVVPATTLPLLSMGLRLSDANASAALKIGFHRSNLPLPNLNSLLGIKIYAQAMFINLNANRLGLVFGDAIAAGVGTKTSQIGSSLLYAPDRSASKGSPRIGQTPVLRLELK